MYLSFMFFFAILLSSTLVLASSKTCYLPNKAIATDSTPCNESADQSHCCVVGDYCLDNSLCYDHTGTISQNACTDPNWAGSDCFQMCKEADSGLPIVATGQWDNINQTFCCDIGTFDQSNNTCLYADKSTPPFNLAAGLIITDRSTGSTEQFNSTHTQQPNATEAAAIHTVTVSSSGNSGSSGGDTTGKEAAIGAGIGVPLGLALLAVSYLLYREKQRTKRRSAARAGSWNGGKSAWAGQVPQQQAYAQYGSDGGATNYQNVPPTELADLRVAEMDGATRAQELEHPPQR